MAVGGSGGSKIFGAVLQVILGIDQWGLDASEAVEYGRVHDQLYPLEVETDSVVPQVIIDGLLERGHNITGLYFNHETAILLADVLRFSLRYKSRRSRRTSSRKERRHYIRLV